LIIDDSSKKILVDLSLSDFQDCGEYYKDQKPNYNIKEFIDEIFPPNKNSVCWVEPGGEVDKDLTDEERQTLDSFNHWVRAKEIFGHNNFAICDKFDIEDINQGEIGNCYFLSVLSAIAEYQERFKDIFSTNKRSVNGCYELKLFLNGIPKTIVLDDYFPVKKHNISWNLAHCEQNEIWVNLLEKAWAKVNGSYASTIAGLPSEAFSVLTHAPCFSYFNRRYSVDEMWKIISDADKENYIICTNSKGDVPEMTGIVRGHAYTLVGAHQYENIRLLKLRNPWGSFEWTGEYSDKSDKWNDELKRIMNFQDKDDGIFFMKIEDFLNYFPYTFICKYKNNYYYEYKKFEQEIRDDFISCKFVVKEKTHAVFTLHQKQQRFFKKIQNYKPAFGSIILAKYNPNKHPNYEYFNSDCNKDEKIHFELENLDVGEYHIFANLNWSYSTYPCRYTISCYSAKEIKFEKLLSDQVPTNYFLQILNSFIKKKKQVGQLDSKSNNQEGGSKAAGFDLDYSLSNNHTGFYVMKFSNYRTSQFLMVSLEVERNENLCFCKKNIDGIITLEETKTDDLKTISKYELLIGKNSNQIISWKLLDSPGKVSLNILSCTTSFCDEVPHSFRNQRDVIQKFIENHIDSTNEQELEENLFLKELEYNDSIIFIVVNRNKDFDFRVKIKLNEYKNIAIEDKTYHILKVKSNSQEYCLFKKEDSNIISIYKLSYSVKRV